MEQLLGYLYSPTFLVTVVISILAYYYLCTPLNYTKDLSSVGYDTEVESSQAGRWKVKTKGEIARQLSKLRRLGKLPPVVPNGWFAVLEADVLKVGQVKYVAALDQNLAVFRDEKSGDVHVLDAYCPHLGANLAVGGTVRGDCLKCPFHGWSFRGKDGQCTNIPYSSKVPECASVKSWECCEVNSLIFVWHHAEGAGPDWTPQHLPQMAQWKYRGKVEHYINAHIQDIPENSADVNHLEVLHGPFLFTERLFGYGLWARHVWSASWQALQTPGSTHKGVMTAKHNLKLFNCFTVSSIEFTSTQIGPGYVEITMDTIFGSAVLIFSITPVGPLLQRVTQRLYTSPTMPQILANLFLLGEAAVIERDIQIWNHKKYQEKPLLVTEDHALLSYRRWYSQFYSENSPRMSRSPSLQW